MSERKTVYMPLDELLTAKRNPKKHVIEDIKLSIDRFGYVEQITLDERTGRIVAGHGRLTTLKELRDTGKQPPDGVTDDWQVPVSRGWASATDDEANAYIVASNNLTTKGGWDDSELLSFLDSLDDLDGTGFTIEDLQEMANKVIELPKTPALTDADSVPDPPEIQSQSRAMFGRWVHIVLFVVMRVIRLCWMI